MASYGTNTAPPLNSVVFVLSPFAQDCNLPFLRGLLVSRLFYNKKAPPSDRITVPVTFLSFMR